MVINTNLMAHRSGHGRGMSPGCGGGTIGPRCGKQRARGTHLASQKHLGKQTPDCRAGWMGGHTDGGGQKGLPDTGEGERAESGDTYTDAEEKPLQEWGLTVGAGHGLARVWSCPHSAQHQPLQNALLDPLAGRPSRNTSLAWVVTEHECNLVHAAHRRWSLSDNCYFIKIGPCVQKIQ